MDSAKLENVKKKVFKLLLQDKYSSYDDACEVFKTKNLHDRRSQLCLKFANKEFAKESIFKKFAPNRVNRHTHMKLVEEFNCNTDRYFMSSIPYLSRMINEDNANRLK